MSGGWMASGLRTNPLTEGGPLYSGPSRDAHRRHSSLSVVNRQITGVNNAAVRTLDEHVDDSIAAEGSMSGHAALQELVPTKTTTQRIETL